VKAKKAEKPTRYGIVYALFNKKGEVLVERRPEKGLLGGMLGLPGTAWAEASTAIDRDPGAPRGGASGVHLPALAIVRADYLADEPLVPREDARPRGDGLKAYSGPASESLAGVEGWRHAGTVRHTFTHFHLELEVITARAAATRDAIDGQLWLLPVEARLPTVMKKAVERAVATGFDHAA
jgi:A/G-specific adenine glycosylase